MALVGIREMLLAAKEETYAVGAFNIVDYNSLLAVVRAGEELSSPVIVQTSVKTVLFWGCSTLLSWVKEVAENSPVPIALHLDHCKDLEVIRQCIETGWTSVMIDASAKPFHENLATSRQVVEMATPAGVDVEAELGKIGRVAEDSGSDQDSHLVDVEEAVAFCTELNLAAFAPAIGTLHGMYRGEPKIAFDRLEEIARRVDVPIALHGGTGLSDDVFRKCISLGCAKINISTQLKYAFVDGFVEYHNAHNEEYNPLKVIAAQFDRIQNEMAEKMKLFGSAGRVSQGED